MLDGRLAVRDFRSWPHSRSTRIQDHFSDLTDPRRRKVVYPPINVVTIAVCAVIAEADDFVSIAAWARQKRDRLASTLDLGSGIPSHGRFNAVFAAPDPAEFEKCLLSWITALHEITDGQVIAIDGETLRRSFDAAGGKAAIHRVGAWATAASAGWWSSGRATRSRPSPSCWRCSNSRVPW